MRKALAAMVLAVLLCGCSSLMNRMAFYPDRQNVVSATELPAQVREVWITTEDREGLQCYLVRNEGSQRLLIYFHGNAGNVGQRVPELMEFARAGVSVLGVGYRGYGQSTGKPSEKGIYADGRAGLSYGVEMLGYAMTNIFICGRSIGTTVAINTAQDQPLAGLILITPLTTGKEFARAHGLGWVSSLSGNAFDNLSKCAKIRAPTLVIEGSFDELMPNGMGQKVIDRIPGPKRLVTIQGGQHNTLEFQDPEAYWGAIGEFIQGKMTNSQ